jgi:phage tail sheath protein FI
MPEYLAPGVFVEEVSYRAKSIEGVSTTTTGFVGATRFGPIDIEPDVITSLVEFERIYGGRQQLEFVGTTLDNYMWNAVRAFFEEGGKRLYVSRAFQGDIDTACAKVAGKLVPPANIAIRARFPGKAGEARVRLQFWVSQNRLVLEPIGGGKHKAILRSSFDRDTVYVGNDAKKGIYFISYDIQKDLWNFENKDGTSKFELQDLAETNATIRTITASVYVEPSEPGLPFFAVANLALDRGHKTAGAPDSIFDYFAAEPANLSASRSIPIVVAALTLDQAQEEKTAADLVKTNADKADKDAKKALDAANKAVTDAENEKGIADAKLVAALDKQANPDPGDDPNDLAAAVAAAELEVTAAQAKIDLALPLVQPAADAKAATAAALVEATERAKAAADIFATAGDDNPPRNGAKIASDYLSANKADNRFVIADLEGTGSDAAKARSEGKAPFLDAVFFLAGGKDGQVPGLDAYAGEEDQTTNRKSGLKAFEDIEDISIVAAPGSTYALAAKTDAQAIANALIGHAERMQYRIAVLDSIKGQSIADVRAYRAMFDSSHAAFYYPWIRTIDPNTGQENYFPPSGFVAGIYARNDIERAVYKAPANEVVTLALGFEKMINKAQQEVLNPEGINCFRFFEGRGMRLWGARTMSSDPEWKYVNLRRYFAYLERSIDKGTQWAVFEPNGERLWANVRRTIEDFLLNEWQSGALLGDKPERSYFVKCDRSTMTQNDLDNGRLICLVGVAPLRPAEFVIFRIGQWTADRKS